MAEKDKGFLKLIILDVIGSALIFGIFYYLNSFVTINLLPISVIAIGLFSLVLLKLMAPKK